MQKLLLCQMAEGSILFTVHEHLAVNPFFLVRKTELTFILILHFSKPSIYGLQSFRFPSLEMIAFSTDKFFKSINVAGVF